MTTPPRHFSVEHANRMLPLVRRIAADIVRDYRQWQDAVAAFEVEAAGAQPGMPNARATALQREVERTAADIDGYVRELAALGVECKSLGIGLVDFPGEVDGVPAYLCWKLGEPAVAWWHPRDAGFAGRQPLAHTAARAVEAEAAR